MNEGMTAPNWESTRWREGDDPSSLHQSGHPHNPYGPPQRQRSLVHNQQQQQHHHHHQHQHQHQHQQQNHQHPQHAHPNPQLHQTSTSASVVQTSPPQHDGLMMNSYGRQQHPAHPVTSRDWENPLSIQATPDLGTSSNPSTAMPPSGFPDSYAENYEYRSRVPPQHDGNVSHPPYTHDATTPSSSSGNQPIIPNDAWRSLQQRDRQSSGPPAAIADGSLTLQIPRTQDFRRAPPVESHHRSLEGLPFSAASSPQPQVGQPFPYGHTRQPHPRQQQHHHHHHHQQQQQQQQHQPQQPPSLPTGPISSALQPTPTAITPPGQSLPSFASFREHANRDETDEASDIGPHLSCFACTKWKPMVRDVAVAVVELDEDVGLLSQRTDSRVLKFPVDSPVRTAQWILDRLKDIRSDLQDSYRRGQLPTRVAQLTSDSPPNHLKRASEQWDRDDMYDPKRSRSGMSPNTFDDRRSSIEFLTRKASYQRPGLTPPPSESVSSIGHAKPSTPPLSTRSGRPLPPPSPLSYPPSAAQIQTPLTAQPMDATGNYHALNHTQPPAAAAANSTQIAELQHQIGLKSLALQTLQGEYASLLQKLQKERVKNQTIERKTTVSDHEVNELTAKNEELNERVKALEEQVEEGEKRREADRANAAREKEQWGRMLEMSGRLQARHQEDRQKLADENAALQKRITMKGQLSPSDVVSSNDQKTPAMTDFAAQREGSDSPDSPGMAQRENDALRERVRFLTSTLNEVARQTKIMDLRARDLLQQNDNVESTIHKALKTASELPAPAGGESRETDENHGRANTSIIAQTFASPSESILSASGPDAKSEFKSQTPSRKSSTQQVSSTIPTDNNRNTAASAHLSPVSDRSSPTVLREAESESPQSVASGQTNLLQKYGGNAMTSNHSFVGLMDGLPAAGMPPPPRPVAAAAWEGGF